MQSVNKNKVFVAMSPKQSLRDATGQAGGLSSPEKKLVFVAMSGGVDSSVAAWILKNQGYEVVGVFMRCVSGEFGRTTGGSPSTSLRTDCTTEVDATDARRVAEKIGIPFYVWDFEEEYKRRVVDYMVDGYRQGITPNPDVICNREIKFGLFFERARAIGADYVATGHYVRIIGNVRDVQSEQLEQAERSNKQSDRTFQLFAAKDAAKDQSYFLWTLTQEKLRHCLFPIGDYLKSEVREMARKAGLPTAEKKDSQGICFLGKVTLEDFLGQYIPERRGAVVTTTGQEIGEHNGAYFYTIGQRHLGIKYQVSNIRGRHETKPHYVVEKDVATNTVVVAEGSDNPALYKKEIELRDVSFISPEYHFLIRANEKIGIWARVRYRQPLASAKLKIKGEKLKIIFDVPQKFVAPGQSAVFYINEGPSSPSAHPSTPSSGPRGSGRSSSASSELRMLGGGVIA